MLFVLLTLTVIYLHSDGEIICLSLATLTRSALNNLLSLTRALFIAINFLFVNVGSHSDVKNIERAIQCTKVRGSVFCYLAPDWDLLTGYPLHLQFFFPYTDSNRFEVRTTGLAHTVKPYLGYNAV